MNKRLLALLFSLGCAAALGQTPQPPGPVPVHKVPPAGSQCTVVIRTKNAATPPPAENGKPGARTPVLPVRLDIRVGKNGVQQRTVTYSDGHRRTFYVVGNRILQPYDHSEKIAVLSADAVSRSPYSMRGEAFPGTFWIAPSHYTGRAALEKTPCDQYEADGLPEDDLDANFVLKAWVTTADGYPKAVEMGTSVYLFSTPVASTENIQLPPAYRAALEKEAKRLRVLERLRAGAGK